MGLARTFHTRQSDRSVLATAVMTLVLLWANSGLRADLVLHFSFNDDGDPGLDDSGNDYVGEIEGAMWVDDDEREGALEFTAGSFVRVRDFDELPGDDFTITFWARRDPLTKTAGNDGLFQVQFGSDAPSTAPAAKVIGGWVAGSNGVWGRLHQADLTRVNLDANTFFMEDDVWTHFAYRGDGELFEVVVNGETGVGPLSPYDGTLDLHDALFIGVQGSESWAGRIDDFRVYSRALTDDEIAAVMEEEDVVEPPPCPEVGDTHCAGLTYEGPDGDVTGAYILSADASDENGDAIRYRFTAESDDGLVRDSGPQFEDTARFNLTEGTWTVSVLVDDSGSCEDEAADATCTIEIVVNPREASPDDQLVHLTFDEEDEPGLDSSGNDLDGVVEGALWVDDDEREGSLEFTAADDGFVRVLLPEELPGGDFTIAFWAWRDPFAKTGGNDGLFQLQAGGDVPSTDGGQKVIGAWVAGSNGVWGRLHQADLTRMNLDANTFFMEDEVWTHFAYRGDGETFEVVINAESGIGPAVAYDGSLAFHDTLFIGKQGVESWAGRIDDFQVYTRALDDDEIERIMEGEDLSPPPEGPTFLRGDADANGTLQITDAISVLNFLFSGTFTPPCMDAQDWNDNGKVELADAIGILGRQFSGGDPAPAPGSDVCGIDPTADDLDCKSFAACQ